MRISTNWLYSFTPFGFLNPHYYWFYDSLFYIHIHHNVNILKYVNLFGLWGMIFSHNEYTSQFRVFTIPYFKYIHIHHNVNILKYVNLIGQWGMIFSHNEYTPHSLTHCIMNMFITKSFFTICIIIMLIRN